MTSLYLQSKRHRLLKIMFWLMILLAVMFLFTGCVKQPDAVQGAANAAHQQVVAIKESLPKECQSKANEEQMRALDETIDTIVTNCELQKDEITAEKLKWMYSFFALAIIVLAHIARKVLK